MLATIEQLVRQFFAEAASAEESLYSEAGLHHELAPFLRSGLLPV